MNLGPEHFHHMAKKVNSFSEKLQRFKDKMRSPTAKVVRTTGIAIGALTAGVVEGKMGPGGATVAHFPINLAAGIGLNLLGYFKTAGDKYSHHLCDIGDGFIANVVTSYGFQWGQKWHDTGRLFGHGGTAEALPPGGSKAVTSGHISPEAMADLAQRVRAAGL